MPDPAPSPPAGDPDPALVPARPAGGLLGELAGIGVTIAPHPAGTEVPPPAGAADGNRPQRWFRKRPFAGAAPRRAEPPV